MKRRLVPILVGEAIWLTVIVAVPTVLAILDGTGNVSAWFSAGTLAVLGIVIAVLLLLFARGGWARQLVRSLRDEGRTDTVAFIARYRSGENASRVGVFHSAADGIELFLGPGISRTIDWTQLSEIEMMRTDSGLASGLRMTAASDSTVLEVIPLGKLGFFPLPSWRMEEVIASVIDRDPLPRNVRSGMTEPNLPTER